MNAKKFPHKILAYLGFVLLVLFSHEINAIAQGKFIKAENKPGKYLSENKEFQFELSVSGMGGFLIMSAGPVNQEPKTNIDDASGVVWLSENEIVYSVSQIYGRPGIFLLDCRTGKIKVLVKPETFSKYSPDGADYFELKGLSVSKREILYFYSKDIEKTDFENFRTESNLRRFWINQNSP